MPTKEPQNLHQDNTSQSSKKHPRERNEQLHAKSLMMFWMEALGMVVVIIVLGMGLVLFSFGQQSQATANLVLDAKVEDLARRLARPLEMYQRMLRGLALDHDLAQVVTHGNAAEITKQEQILAHIIPGALRVRLLPLGHDALDLNSNPPLSYASVMLLRLAETASQPPPLEIHLSADNKLYVVGATGLQDKANQVRGLLHLTLPAAVLRDEMEHFDKSYGMVALQQQVDNQFATILGADISDRPHDGMQVLAASQARLVYWHVTDTGITTWPVLLPSLATMLTMLLMCLAAMAIQYWRLNKALLADQTTLLHALKATLNGLKNKHLHVTIQEYAAHIEAVVKLAQEFRTKKHSVRTTAGKVSTIEGEVQTVLNNTEDRFDGEITQGTSTTPTTTVTTPIVPATKKSIDPPKEQPSSIQTAVATKVAENQVVATAFGISLPEVLFRAYDIRGIVGQVLTTTIAYEVGRTIGSLLQEKNKRVVSVGRDDRPSGEDISKALIEGLMASGRDVVDLGMVTTPLLHFATNFLESDAGIMVGAERFPKEYNGFKVLVDGEIVEEKELLDLRQRALDGKFWQGAGSRRDSNIIKDYIQRIADDISIARPLKVVIDCGSGCTALVAPQLFQTIGCDVIELFCKVDHNYPGHQPDPNRPENLKSLQAMVLSEQADLGLAFDADGDQLGVVDSKGRIIWADRLLMLLAADVLARNPGSDIIFDVNCSRALTSQILQNGGRPVMWQSNHVALKTKLRNTQALLAGSWNGHIIFQERWYGFDDACYVGARLMEILAVDARSSAEIFEDFPDTISTPEFTLRLPDGEAQQLIEKLRGHTDMLRGVRLVTTDGLRAEFEDGWGLVRTSSTMAALRFRFEADTESALNRIQQVYRDLFVAVVPNLKLPF